MTDPFSAPAAVASAHASADSFRGRLVLITPTAIEYNVPKQATNPTGEKGNKVIADVTVVDGLGPVQVFTQRVASGQWLEGPDFKGVWFSQDRLAMKGGLVDVTKSPVQIVGMVLGRLETYKPGKMSGQGNGWGLLDPTEDDKQIAREFLTARALGQATATVAAASPAPAGETNPFGDKAPF
jgi:hypothetical protein